MNSATIALGTNIGERMENLNRAVASIAALPRTFVKKISSVYETKPVGYENQPDFLNAVLEVGTEMTPHALLGACLGIEAAMGRERGIKNGPRIIDIDLLLYEAVKIESYELTLPHPRILERVFVMLPLMDIYPTGRAPGLFFAPKLKELSPDGAVKLEGTDIMKPE